MITFLEKDIEDYVCANVESVFGSEYRYVGRQIDIGVGILDVLLFKECEGELVVVEIKKGEVNSSALSQVMRYMRGLEDYLEESEWCSGKVWSVRGLLLGESLEEGVCTSIRLIDDKVSFWGYKAKFSIEADESNWNRNKDHSTYKPKEFNEKLEHTLNRIIEGNGDESG